MSGATHLARLSEMHARAKNGRPEAARKLREDTLRHHARQLQPVVDRHVSHFMQVPLRTSVKFMHSGHASPS